MNKYNIYSSKPEYIRRLMYIYHIPNCGFVKWCAVFLFIFCVYNEYFTDAKRLFGTIA